MESGQRWDASSSHPVRGARPEIQRRCRMKDGARCLIILIITNFLREINITGALDSGLDIPHSDKRFAGFKKDEKALDAKIHRKYIYGGHVADYMKASLKPLLPR